MRKAIPVVTRLAITLRFLATGDSYKSLSYLFRVSDSSLSAIIPEVDVALEVCMPKCVLNCSLTANQGKYSYDPVSKVLVWDIGRIELPKLPNIKGTTTSHTLIRPQMK
ncbi:Clathrin coat assembly protein [Operophtera brumata]|uniref:Clathrin coat assembly protein n=1 Tax=Operophtera brumata TaxID=104452 RepID=A0A0L7K3G9_OPEBR|nr:Clathrin coat assembly protein [Operophtera brumata]